MRWQELVQRRCHVAVDFETELYQWMDDDYYNNNVYKIQLPYTQVIKAFNCLTPVSSTALNVVARFDLTLDKVASKC